jgi:hypothetical protein
MDRLGEADLKAIETEIGRPGGPDFALGSVACSMSCRSEAGREVVRVTWRTGADRTLAPPTFPPATTFADYDDAQVAPSGST